MKNYLSLIILLLAALYGSAAEPLRPVSSTWGVEVGGSLLADTYLTPLKYRGLHLGLSCSRSQAMRFKPEKWTNSLRFRVEFDRAKNRAGNSVMYSAGIAGGWSMDYCWRLPHAILLKAGGAVDADLGALLLARNSNNPAQARASLTVGPEVAAYWAYKRLWGVGLEMRSPLIGAFFSPDYGELYYEISLGNHGGLVHCAWPGSFRRLTADLFVDIRPGASALRVGYRADLLSFRACGLTGRSLSNSLVIAINCDFLSVNPRKKSDEAKIFSNTY